jgi:hypothetical protein
MNEIRFGAVRLPVILCGWLWLAAPGTQAHASAGVCPDGSVFVVSRPEQAPCAGARFVDPSDLPPLRPQYLPRPYLWHVDQQLRDENNPYNLVERAAALRELRTRGSSAGSTAAQPAQASTQPAPAPAPAQGQRGPQPRAEAAFTAGRRPGATALTAPQPSAPSAPLRVFSDTELRDLTQLIALGQELAPASLVVSDAAGAEQLTLRFAHSSGAEARLRAELRQPRAQLVLFSARAARALEFHPNFLFAQDGATFRPDPQDRAQGGFLLGAAGPLPQGELRLGYLLLPERFDLRRPLQLWWNDRQLEVTLQVEGPR